MDYPILLLRVLVVDLNVVSPQHFMRKNQQKKAAIQELQCQAAVRPVALLRGVLLVSSLVAHGKTRQSREKPNDNGSNRAAAAGIKRTAPSAKVGLEHEKDEAMKETRGQSQSSDHPKCQTRRRLEGCHDIKENNQGTETEGDDPKLARRFQHGPVLVDAVVDVVVVATIGHKARQADTIRCIAKEVSQIKNGGLDQAARRDRDCGQNQCHARRQKECHANGATRPAMWPRTKPTQ
jgi:hypothetical protein